MVDWKVETMVDLMVASMAEMKAVSTVVAKAEMMVD